MKNMEYWTKYSEKHGDCVCNKLAATSAHFLRPQTQRKFFPPKHWWTSTELHGITTQIILFRVHLVYLSYNVTSDNIPALPDFLVLVYLMRELVTQTK
jgi:hypothetical protein